jgi:hypothetical protein
VKQERSLIEALICHKSAGRLRLKVPSKKGNAAYFNELKNAFSEIEGLQGIEVNQMTASVLLLAADTKKIADYAASKELFIIKDEPMKHDSLRSGVADAFRIINGKLKSVTGGDIDAAGAAFLALAGIGIYQISRGNFAAPAWYTAFWYALNIFLKSDKGN